MVSPQLAQFLMGLGVPRCRAHQQYRWEFPWPVVPPGSARSSRQHQCPALKGLLKDAVKAQPPWSVCSEDIRGHHGHPHCWDPLCSRITVRTLLALRPWRKHPKCCQPCQK